MQAIVFWLLPIASVTWSMLFKIWVGNWSALAFVKTSCKSSLIYSAITFTEFGSPSKAKSLRFNVNTERTCHSFSFLALLKQWTCVIRKKLWLWQFMDLWKQNMNVGFNNHGKNQNNNAATENRLFFRLPKNPTPDLAQHVACTYLFTYLLRGYCANHYFITNCSFILIICHHHLFWMSRSSCNLFRMTKTLCNLL